MESSSQTTQYTNPASVTHGNSLDKKGRNTPTTSPSGHRGIGQPNPERVSSKGWAQLAKKLWKYDTAKVRDCKEDIDTLQVFAGLFSAVLTAFNIEAYKMLKKDPMDVSTCLLAQIAQQAGPPSNTSQAQNPSSPVACSDFQAQPLAVHVNILWFASLVCSLVTASIGILVKQWLREYLAGERSSPRERLRLRHVRYEGLVRWRVFEIAALLPLLLQLSLALFFIGLIIFLNALHPTVGQVITVFISVWFFAMLSTTFAPAIAFNCSYKLPSLKRLMQAIRHCWYRAHFVIKQQHFLEELYRDVCLEGADEETIIRQKNDLDIHILVGADATLFDDGILDVTIRECLATTSGEAAFDFVNQTLTHRLDRLRPSRPCEISSKIPECFVHILLDAVNREVESRIDDSSQVTLPPWIGEALTCMAGDGRLSYTFGKASMKDTSIRETTCTALGFLLEAEDHSVARQVILFLGTHTHLQDTLPILSSPFIIRNMLLGVREAVRLPSSDPLSVCESVLKLSSQIESDIIRDSTQDLRHLLTEVTFSLHSHYLNQAFVGLAPNESANRCLELANQLNRDHNCIIAGADLFDVLNILRLRYGAHLHI